MSEKDYGYIEGATIHVRPGRPTLVIYDSMRDDYAEQRAAALAELQHLGQEFDADGAKPGSIDGKPGF